MGRRTAEPARSFSARSSADPGSCLQALPGMVTFSLGKIRRDNYVLLTWIGDHSPRHVHIYRDEKLVLKWNLDAWVPNPTAKLIRLLADLRKERVL